MVRRSLPVLPTIALVLVAASACDVNRALEDVHRARHLAADLLTHFTRASNASNLAVMADTDETSASFAAQAHTHTSAAQKDAETLKPLLERLGYAEEIRELDAFRSLFDEYRTLDRTVLDLAVENTNLKAQRLSLSSAQESVDALGKALAALEPSTDSKEGWRVKAIAASALASAREISALHAAHIAEGDDAAMDGLENRMASAEASARRDLATLKKFVRPDAAPTLATAASALDRLLAVNRQIVDLSRRNTNVRSLALSLNQKRTIVAACEERLHALQTALGRRGYVGTR